jgi:tripartite-type tricarboxylate transporter receptor subunit TctC
MHRSTRITAGFAFAALFASAPYAQPAAVDFPTKPVRINTPFPVGSGPETVVRMMAQSLSKIWQKPVIVENRPGANGSIAIDAFKRGATDGHDLIQLDNVHLSAYQFLFKKLPYNPQKDFEPLLPLFKAAFFFTVATNSPYKSVGDLIADGKTKNGQLNYGSWSVGNPVHLGSELFASMTGTKFEHVIYKETSQLYTGVANGELAFALGSSGTSGSLYRAGRLRYLAVAGPRRLPAYPDVPTVTESGGPTGFEVVGWTAIAVPRGLDAAIVEKIRRDIEQALSGPEVRERFDAFGYEPFVATREEFDAFIQSESGRFADVIRKANLSLD